MTNNGVGIGDEFSQFRNLASARRSSVTAARRRASLPSIFFTRTWGEGVSDSWVYGEAFMRLHMWHVLLARDLAQSKHSLNCSTSLLPIHPLLTPSPSTHTHTHTHTGNHFLILRMSFQGYFMDIQINSTCILIFSIFTQKFIHPTPGVSKLFP